MRIRKYHVGAVREIPGDGFEVKVVGPGIVSDGVGYHVLSAEEGNLLVEDLNLAYGFSKHLSNSNRSKSDN